MTAAEIQKLRELTSAGVMDCKKALLDANGDFDAAVKLIHERGQSQAEKRSDRQTGAGLVHSYVQNPITHAPQYEHGWVREDIRNHTGKA